MLWLSGGPGKGKTTMTLLVLDNVRTSTLAQGRVVLSFFCDAQGERTRSALDILRSFILQILIQKRGLFELVSQFFDPQTHSIMGGKDKVQGLCDIFGRLLEHCSAICVLDGVDECTDSEAAKVLRYLRDRTTATAARTDTGMLKCFIASRPSPLWIPEALHSTNPGGTSKLDLDILSDITRKSMEKFVDVKITDFISRDIMQDVNTDELRKQLVEQAEGTFLWVSLACRLISGHGSVEAALKETSKGLFPMLRRTIESHLSWQGSEGRRLCLELLHTVAASARPMTLTELSSILGVEGDSTVTSGGKVEARVRACGPVLEISGDKVKILHKSVRDYLLQANEELLLSSHQQYAFEMDYKLAAVCFSVLCENKVYLQSKKYTPKPTLIEYATTFWAHHIRLCERSKSEQLLELFKLRANSLKDHDFLRNWWKISWSHDYTTCLKRQVPAKFFLPHMAAAFGAVSLLEHALPPATSKQRSKKALGELDSSNRTALSWAIENGWLTVVEAILNHYDNVNSPQGPYGTALQTAAIWGQLDIAKMLMTHGADINADESVFGFPLQAASTCGNSDIVKYLLEQGADPNAEMHGWFGSALQAAAAKGAEPVVNLLIESGANVNAEGGWFGSPLVAAAAFGHLQIVQILLARNANTRTAGRANSLLPNRFTHSRREAFKMLRHLSLKRIIDIGRAESKRLRSEPPRDSKARPSIKRAMRDALERVLLDDNRLLQEHLVATIFDVEKLTDVDMSQILSASELDVYLRGIFYANPLQAAAREGHIDTLTELLQLAHHADVNDCVGVFGTPLIAAAAGGHEGIVKALINKGAKCGIKNSRQQTALAVAKKVGNRPVYEIIYDSWLKQSGKPPRSSV